MKITSYDTKESIISFFKIIRNFQEIYPDKIIVCPIKLHDIIKYDLFINNFLIHPKVLIQSEYTEIIESVNTKNDLLKLIEQVIIYETNSTLEKTYLSSEELIDLIKSYRFIEKNVLLLDNSYTIEVPNIVF